MRQRAPGGSELTRTGKPSVKHQQKLEESTDYTAGAKDEFIV